ncbi:MAG: hypothetical protein ACI3ZP_06420 [Candidatus Cryptobacteroides sp.]
MLINFSNHPLAEWQKPQYDSAVTLFGGVIDLPFPEVDPSASLSDVERLADTCLERLMAIVRDDDTVHIMGEHTLTFQMLDRLRSAGIKCVASCTERICTVGKDGNTIRTFRFKGFRSYF